MSGLINWDEKIPKVEYPLDDLIQDYIVVPLEEQKDERNKPQER